MALFGDVTVPFSPAVSLDLGGRLFRSTITEIRQMSAGRISRDSHRTGFTPGVALKWKPGPGRLVFLRYASAVRRGGTDIGPAGDLEILKGDELQNLEAGWRGPLGTDGHFDIGVFASRWQNMQSDMLQASGLIESENAGDARIFGAEATVDVPIRPGWRIEAGATLTDATLARNRLGVKLDDRRLPVVPRLTARATLTHDFTLGKAAMQLRATLRHVGDRRLSFDPAIDRSMDAFLETRIEAQAKLGNMQIMLAAENLAGGSRDSFAYGNPLRFATARQYTPQRPASLSASLLFDF